MPFKILLTTFGSLGDLHPYMALGLALKERGHDPAIAAHPGYRDRIEALGLGFHPIRPDFTEFGDPEEWAPRAMDVRTGPEYVIETLVLPHLKQAYEDLKYAAPGYDTIIGHPLTYAAPIVCEELGIPWISVMLQPVTLFSIYDPPILTGLPMPGMLHRLGPGFHRFLYAQIKKFLLPKLEPIQELRSAAGLKRSLLHPMFEGLYSPLLNLCLFSPLFGPPQRDWPPNSQATGFVFYDGSGAEEMPSELAQFLDEGDPPVVFTLGSSAVLTPGQFYAESIKAMDRLGRRAVLLTGRDAGFDPKTPMPEGVRAFEYAPYSLLFPKAAAIVHQGGIGTTAQALRSGKPQIVVPFSHDQPDNADRIRRLGVGRAVPRDKYRAGRAFVELERLLRDTECAAAASRVGVSIREEDGAGNACKAIENAVNRVRIVM